eukprot:TRINITY_DN27405_c0_g1_i1.p2 TRINITY_DN27405_c0_g1~~TRINITY_DN27405_c0_g1_i1.p2  ORF type:complete len:145 (-),score=48.83 TRINITY_DN27405_c0_g1_i1:236-670(-)
MNLIKSHRWRLSMLEQMKYMREESSDGSGVFFFFKQKTAYEMQRGLVGSEMCIRDRYRGKQNMKKKAQVTAEEIKMPKEKIINISNKEKKRSLIRNKLQKKNINIIGGINIDINDFSIEQMAMKSTGGKKLSASLWEHGPGSPR